jgi:hypothetical protein
LATRYCHEVWEKLRLNNPSPVEISNRYIANSKQKLSLCGWRSEMNFMMIQLPVWAWGLGEYDATKPVIWNWCVKYDFWRYVDSVNVTVSIWKVCILIPAICSGLNIHRSFICRDKVLHSIASYWMGEIDNTLRLSFDILVTWGVYRWNIYWLHEPPFLSTGCEHLNFTTCSLCST